MSSNIVKMSEIQEKKFEILNGLFRTKDGLTWNETTEMLNDLITLSGGGNIQEDVKRGIK